MQIEDMPTARLLKEADNLLIDTGMGLIDVGRGHQGVIERLAEVIRRQEARIAALERPEWPYGPPLEGTGPLPLERKGG